MKIKKVKFPQILNNMLLKQLSIAATILLFLTVSTTLYSQNNTYNCQNQGQYYPNLNEEWVLIKGDTLEGGWIQDTFFQDDNIHSYVFRDSGIETRLNLCNPPTDLIFKTQFGLPYSAAFWTFRSTTEGDFLLGFDEPDENGVSLLTITVQLFDIRFDPDQMKVTGYQNGRKCIVRSPIDRTAFED